MERAPSPVLREGAGLVPLTDLESRRQREAAIPKRIASDNRPICMSGMHVVQMCVYLYSVCIYI